MKMLLVLFSLILLPVVSVQGNTAVELMQYLFNASRYDRKVMPSVGYGKDMPLNVSIGLSLLQIENLDEKRQVLITHLVLTLMNSNLNQLSSRYRKDDLAAKSKEELISIVMELQDALKLVTDD